MKNSTNEQDASYNCIQKLKSNDLFELAGLYDNTTAVSTDSNKIDSERKHQKTKDASLSLFGDYKDYEDFNDVFDSEEFMFKALLESHNSLNISLKNTNNQYEYTYGSKHSKNPIQGTDEHQIELCKMLTEHIVAVLDDNGNKIEYNDILIKYEKRATSKTFSKVLYIDGEPISAKHRGTYKIVYKCRCGRENAIIIKKYFLKEIIRCYHCSQDINYEKDYIPLNSKEWQIKHKDDKKKVTVTDFNLMDEEFKNEYSKIHMSEEQLYYYLPKIFKINKHIISECDISLIKYKYAVPTNNQMHFTPKISFDNGVTYESLKEIYLKCDVCDNIFRIHNDNIFKQDINKIRCQSCKLSNRRYTIRRYSKDSDLTYQSMLEKDFIDIVKSMGLQIENGHTVNYIFENKTKHYIIDFYLPSERLLVEIKAKNQFYKKDTKSGKLQAKVMGAEKYAKQNRLTYLMLIENDVYNFKNILHRLRNENH